MSLPLSDFGRFQPRPGCIYVERDVQPEKTASGLLFLTDAYRNARKSPVATVVAVGCSVRGLEPGMRIVIHAGVGTKVEFGDHEERVIYVCDPSQVIAVLADNARGVEDGGESEQGRFRYTSERFVHASERRSDEGAEKRPPDRTA